MDANSTNVCPYEIQKGRRNRGGDSDMEMEEENGVGCVSQGTPRISSNFGKVGESHRTDSPLEKRTTLLIP